MENLIKALIICVLLLLIIIALKLMTPTTEEGDQYEGYQSKAVEMINRRKHGYR